MSGHKKNDSTCDSTALLRGQSHSRESSGASNLSVKYTITQSSDGSGSPEASATVSTTSTPLKAGAASKAVDAAAVVVAGEDDNSPDCLPAVTIVQRSPRTRKKRIRKRASVNDSEPAGEDGDDYYSSSGPDDDTAAAAKSEGRVHNGSCDSLDTPQNMDGMLQNGEAKSQNSDYGSFCNTPSDSNYLHQNHPPIANNQSSSGVGLTNHKASGIASATSSKNVATPATATPAAAAGGANELDQSVMATESHQRQPLLDNSPSDSSCSDDDAGANSSGYTRRKTRLHQRGSACHIDMPPDGGGGGVAQETEVEGNPEDVHIPGEPLKTLLAFIFLFFGWVASTTFLALTHDYVPNTAHLPDVVLDYVLPYQPWGLNVSEVIIMISTSSAFIVCVFHKHRCVVLRRVFLLVAFHYYYRAITMWVTKLPVADERYKENVCAPQLNHSDITAALIAQRTLKLLSGFGLSINGKHVYCGDYIYSGHTMTLVMGYLVIRAYGPKKKGWYLLHYASFCLSVAGVLFLMMARGHYSIDVIIAYWITTRLWWIYHTMCNNGGLLKDSRNKRNYLKKMWWWKLFQYFETNIPVTVPRQYNLPIPNKILRMKPISYLMSACGAGPETDSDADGVRRRRDPECEAGSGSANQ